MRYLQLILDDIYFSPVIFHLAALLISTLKSIWMKLFSSDANESAGWDSAVMAILFLNPFLAFWADSFWGVWVQTLLLSLPLYLAAFYFRQYVLKTESYRDGSAAMMGAGAMYFFGHALSGALIFIQYLWVLIWR
ncbi:MAG: hypothetical protein EOO52_07290 [Gammaproteobacteria bacterium]|nr:MAG: hypothetical protein EOO52_07290 [Gammaproteobacteria bacterium]